MSDTGLWGKNKPDGRSAPETFLSRPTRRKNEDRSFIFFRSRRCRARRIPGGQLVDGLGALAPHELGILLRPVSFASSETRPDVRWAGHGTSGKRISIDHVNAEGSLGGFRCRRVCLWQAQPTTGDLDLNAVNDATTSDPRPHGTCLASRQGILKADSHALDVPTERSGFLHGSSGIPRYWLSLPAVSNKISRRNVPVAIGCFDRYPFSTCWTSWRS